jgi:hypothetical protein
MTTSTVVVDEAGERASFEAWYTAEYMMPPGAFRLVEGTYEKGFVKDGWEAWLARAHQQPTAPVEAILDAIASLEDRVSETRANIECSDYDDNSELEAYAALTEKRIESLRTLLPANKPTGG